MTQKEQNALACALSSLCVFRRVLQLPPAAALLAFLQCGGDVRKQAARFGAFVYALAEDHYSLSEFLCRAVYADENAYVTGMARKGEVPPVLAENAAAELAIFSRLTRLSAADLFAPAEYGGYIPQFANRPVDFEAAYADRLAHIGQYGYGIFATAKMFRVSGEDILPVDTADAVSLDRFVGYEEQRRQVFANTRALIDGRPAANVLLCGDAGTGKSSTVKACANYYYEQGVRLIELRKDQLFSLPQVMGRVAGNPLKFIIFIDDLSFNKNDDCFSMLKAALEGSAAARAENAVIYATSNRRHIVKEQFSDRAADDVHHSDTVQELLSLSDRFGLTVYFEKPTKQLYLDIVRTLAERRGIRQDADTLTIKAEAFALAKGSRSPRAAEQFVDSLLSAER